jgi:hypothetical protein
MVTSLEVSVGDRLVAGAEGDGSWRARLVAGADGRYTCDEASLSEDDVLSLAFDPTCEDQLAARTGNDLSCDDVDNQTACLAAIAGAPPGDLSAVLIVGLALPGLRGLGALCRRRAHEVRPKPAGDEESKSRSITPVHRTTGSRR